MHPVAVRQRDDDAVADARVVSDLLRAPQTHLVRLDRQHLAQGLANRAVPPTQRLAASSLARCDSSDLAPAGFTANSARPSVLMSVNTWPRQLGSAGTVALAVQPRLGIGWLVRGLSAHRR